MWRIMGVAAATVGLLMSIHGSALADGTGQATGGLLEGTVKKVDVVTGTIQISTGLWGLVGQRLQVSEDTVVKVGDREASVTEILEGSQVTAYYETRDRRNVATYIELVPRFRLPEKPVAIDHRLAP